MPLTDMAYWPGDDENPPADRPRCKATPTAADIEANRAMRRDTWGCALWERHTRDTNRRYRAHSWVLTAEDS